MCNSRAVLEKISQSDRAKEVKDLDLSHDVFRVERALGVHWNVEGDEFVFKIQIKDKATNASWSAEYCIVEIRSARLHSAFRVVSKDCPSRSMSQKDELGRRYSK